MHREGGEGGQVGGEGWYCSLTPLHPPEEAGGEETHSNHRECRPPHTDEQDEEDAAEEDLDPGGREELEEMDMVLVELVVAVTHTVSWDPGGGPGPGGEPGHLPALTNEVGLSTMWWWP